MTVRNGKEVFTTSLPPGVLESFRSYCWENEKKMNEILEELLIQFLRQEKVSKCQ